MCWWCAQGIFLVRRQVTAGSHRGWSSRGRQCAPYATRGSLGWAISGPIAPTWPGPWSRCWPAGTAWRLLPVSTWLAIGTPMARRWPRRLPVWQTGAPVPGHGSWPFPGGCCGWRLHGWQRCANCRRCAISGNSRCGWTKSKKPVFHRLSIWQNPGQPGFMAAGPTSPLRGLPHPLRPGPWAPRTWRQRHWPCTPRPGRSRCR